MEVHVKDPGTTPPQSINDGFWEGAVDKLGMHDAEASRKRTRKPRCVKRPIASGEQADRSRRRRRYPSIRSET